MFEYREKTQENLLQGMARGEFCCHHRFDIRLSYSPSYSLLHE
jgi:hypothetical protein